MDNGMMNKTMGLLSHMLDFRSKNHGVIASNLSNVDTPGYKPQELEFDGELRRALDRTNVHLRKTDEKHLPLGAGEGGPSFETHALRAKGGGRELDIDREMAKMAQNNLLYEATVKLLSKRFEQLKIAIEGRR